MMQAGANAQQHMFAPPGVGYDNGWGTPDSKRQKP
jgi:hypothetical protein